MLVLKYNRMTLTRNFKKKNFFFKMLAFPAQKELIAQVFVAWRYVLGLLGFVIYYMLPDRKSNAIDSILRNS